MRLVCEATTICSPSAADFLQGVGLRICRGGRVLAFNQFLHRRHVLRIHKPPAEGIPADSPNSSGGFAQRCVRSPFRLSVAFGKSFSAEWFTQVNLRRRAHGMSAEPGHMVDIFRVPDSRTACAKLL